MIKIHTHRWKIGSTVRTRSRCLNMIYKCHEHLFTLFKLVMLNNLTRTSFTSYSATCIDTCTTSTKWICFLTVKLGRGEIFCVPPTPSTYTNGFHPTMLRERVHRINSRRPHSSHCPFVCGNVLELGHVTNRSTTSGKRSCKGHT